MALCGAAAGGGTPEYIAGDFTVINGATEVLTNRTLVIDGDVAVQAGALLELHNSTILLNLSVNGSQSLTVAAGGTLRAFDLDALPQTTADRSLIGSANPARRYVAHFEPGSNVLFRASALSGFGYSLAAPGLLIESGNVTFDDASLEAYVFLRVEGVSPTFEGTLFAGDGTGSNYFYASDALLANCTFTRHLVAVSASNGSALMVADALLRDTVFSFAANGSSLSVSRAVVNNSTSGVFLTNGSTAVFTDVQFDASAVALGDAGSTLRAFREFVVRVVNGASDPVRNATVAVRNATNATLFSGNTGAVGHVGPSALLAFTINSTGRFNESNVTASATKVSNLTERPFSPLLEPSPVTLTVLSNVDPRVVLLSPAPGAVLLSGLAASFSVNATDPDATPGGITVTWRSSLQGPLGSGTFLATALGAGSHTIEVDVRDLQDGFRGLSFNVTVEPGANETFSAIFGGLWYNATVFKTSRGSFALTRFEKADAPPLAFGQAVMFHPTTGALTWSYAVIAIPYDPALIPVGTYEDNLTVRAWFEGLPNGTAGVTLEAVIDNSSHVAVVSIPLAMGFGTFMVEGVKGNNDAPVVDEPSTLSAVVGQPFSYRVGAKDTPGDPLAFSILEGALWISIDAFTGELAGTPRPEDRGLLPVRVRVSDGLGGMSDATVRVFVSGAVANAPPQVLNPRFSPPAPLGAGPVTIEATFFDPDGDLPLVMEVVIDGDPHAMAPVAATDINTSDGKVYAVTVELAVGRHNITFRTTDGAPGHEGFVTIEAPALVVSADSLRSLNNWFLSLLASVALTLALFLYVRSRASVKGPPKAKDLPEDRATFLEGRALKRIPPAPKIPQKKVSREADLDEEAEAAAKEARRDEARAKAKLADEGEDE